jgi:hypothetical protein
MSREKVPFMEPEKFEGAWALTRSTGWSSSVSAVLFDFAGDDLTLKPPAKPRQKNESWVRVKEGKKLEKAMESVDASSLTLITFKSCLTCDRRVVGAYFAEDFIQLTYSEDDGSMEFWKIDPMALESGGDGGGGGGG